MMADRDNASFEVAKLLVAHAGDFEASVEAVADLIISEREKARAATLADAALANLVHAAKVHVAHRRNLDRLAILVWIAAAPDREVDTDALLKAVKTIMEHGLRTDDIVATITTHTEGRDE